MAQRIAYKDGEEFISLFKNGLRNSCWEDYEDNDSNASL